MADIFARQRTIIGTTAQWAANDLVIGYGEIAIDASIGNFKIGDGVTTFSNLQFYGGVYLTAADIANLVPQSRVIATGGGLQGGGDLSANRTLSIQPSSNGFGTRTISTAQPTGGSNGDIWYVV